MSYTIDEKTFERQQILAEILNPLTAPVLADIPEQSIASILDLGCGQGNTTRFLAESFPGATTTGLEYDSKLVAYASAQAANRPGVSFQQGDAQKLPYPDASFDLVFCRYLLLHLPDPDAAIREMLRVTKPGGYTIAYEPDCFLDMSYPPNPSLATMTFLLNKLSRTRTWAANSCIASAQRALFSFKLAAFMASSTTRRSRSGSITSLRSVWRRQLTHINC